MLANSLSEGVSKSELVNKIEVPVQSNVIDSQRCMCSNQKINFKCDDRLIFTVSKGIRQTINFDENNTKLPNDTLTFFMLLKICAVLFLVFDVLYLHIDLQSVKDSLKNSKQTIESLESQLKFTKLSYKSFKADVNYLMYLNRMLTKDINLKIDLLIKLNKMFVDRADISLNSIISTLRSQKSNDNEISRIVERKFKGLSNGLDKNKTILANKNYPKNELEVNSLRDSDEFHIIFGENNASSLNSIVLEKDNTDSKIVLKNASLSEALFLYSGSHRTKRQSTNNAHSVNRGKHHNSKSKKRAHHRHTNCNLFCCSAGPLLTHFKGAQPEALIQDGGSVIAPWFEDVAVPGDYINRNVVLRDGKTKLEVAEKGLYLIYAQVYYLTSNQLNSFSINIQNEEKATEKVVAMCSAEAAVQGMSEVSCYTSVVHHLDIGDKIFLIQRERYRRIIFREGQTFLGIVVLNNPPKC